MKNKVPQGSKKPGQSLFPSFKFLVYSSLTWLFSSKEPGCFRQCRSPRIGPASLPAFSKFSFLMWLRRMRKAGLGSNTLLSQIPPWWRRVFTRLLSHFHFPSGPNGCARCSPLTFLTGRSPADLLCIGLEEGEIRLGPGVAVDRWGLVHCSRSFRVTVKIILHGIVLSLLGFKVLFGSRNHC